MRVISKFDADHLLANNGLKIGKWNELTDTIPGSVKYIELCPSKDALELYVVAKRIRLWLPFSEWMLFQIDNSTAPEDDEVKVFELLVLQDDQQWVVSEQKSFLIEDVKGRAISTIDLLIYFSLLFEWHVHLTTAHSKNGQRLVIQDGIIYFFGDDNSIKDAEAVITVLHENPLSFSE